MIPGMFLGVLHHLQCTNKDSFIHLNTYSTNHKNSLASKHPSTLTANPTNKMTDFETFHINRYDIEVADGYGSKENQTHWNGMVGLVSRQVRYPQVRILPVLNSLN